MSVIVENSKDT